MTRREASVRILMFVGWKRVNSWEIVLAVLCAGVFMASCGARQARPEGFFAPPTRAGAALPPVTQPAITPTPAAESTQTAAPSCSDGLRFIEDVTIPDGSLVTPGELLDKRWRVENNGSCNWDSGYRLKLVGGPDLGAASEQALYPARSGTQATIRMVFSAPGEAGVYNSAWQAYSPDGEAFGDLIYIEIQVQG